MRGEQLAYEIRRRWRHVKIIGMSENLLHAPITLLTDLFTAFIYKGDLPRGREPIGLYETLEGAISRAPGRAAQIFIVHGHSSPIVAELTAYLQNRLGLPPPIILRERPGSGRTLIEKFERDVREVDIVFVLLTPDDRSDKRNPRRSRQNVIFELGFFYGKLQRSSGRVVLLKKGVIELPSDIQGLSYIDITNGIESAGEEIRRELEEVQCLP
jgi:predicted nucleotide-binding protein